jgi:hypothetical protein
MCLLPINILYSFTLYDITFSIVDRLRGNSTTILTVFPYGTEGEPPFYQVEKRGGKVTTAFKHIKEWQSCPMLNSPCCHRLKQRHFLYG